jgi:molecular chaperone GrpE
MADRDPQAQTSADADKAQADAPQQPAERDEHAIEQQLSEARQKAEENWNQFLRARAELDNARRRAERDIEQAHKFALEKFAGELLAVRDSLEMGVAASQESGADVGKLREGSELTLRMLKQAMEKFHIVEVNPQGQKFDPSRHEAMAAQESADHEPNTVLHVVQKGYLLNDRLLRPAMVVVTRAPARPSGGIDEKA